MRLPRPLASVDRGDMDIPPEKLAESLRLFDHGRKTRRNKSLEMPEFMRPNVWVSKNIRLLNITEREGWLEFTGYQRAMADAFVDEDCRDITALKGTRVGWSLFIAAMVAYFVAYLGESVTIAQPTEEDANEYQKEVIEPIIEACEALKSQRIPGAWNLIQFRNGGCIRLVGAAADDAFRRYRSRRNIADEYSAVAWAPKKGSQGSKLDLFRERGGDWYHSTLAAGSSPLSKESCRTYGRWLESDQRYPFVVCPKCDVQQVMEWGDHKDDAKAGFKWTCDETTGFVASAWYQCVSGCKITESDKFDLDASLEYLPTAVPTTPGHRGFHIPQWLSFAGQASWINITQRYVTSVGNPELMKTFTNNVCGWVSDEYTTSAMESKTVHAILKPYAAEVPDDVLLLTAGGDTQDNKEGSALEKLASRELTVVGWTGLGQFRVIATFKVLGEPGDPASDAELRELLNQAYHKRDGSKWFIQAAAIDLGGMDYADETRRFCNAFPVDRNIWAIKGNAHRKDFVFPRGKSTSSKGDKYYTIDSHNARSGIFNLMLLQGDRAPMVPLALGAAYLDKLMCQERFKKDGRWTWRDKKGQRAEEEWMTLAYAYAALKGLQVSYKKRWADLNLAARRLAIPEIVHDPVTGEIGYSGQDFSLPAMLASSETRQLDAVPIEPETRRATGPSSVPLPVPQQTAKTEEPQAAPASVGRSLKKRKRHPGGIVGWV